MKARPRVHVIQRKGRCLYLRYRNPRTGEVIERSTETNVRRLAERMAAKWEEDIASHGLADPDRILWAEVRLRFQAEHLSSLAVRSRKSSIESLELFDAAVRVTVMSDITEAVISRWAAWLRRTPWREATDDRPAEFRSETTIDKHLANLKTALSWSVSQKLLREVPQFPRLKRSKRRLHSGASLAKGRPLTDSEVNRMVAAIDPPSAEWEFLVRGLVASGLRLSEALALSWEPSDPFRVILKDGKVFLSIPAEGEKGFKDRLCPAAPDFAAMLLAIPSDRRNSKVFKLPKQKRRGGEEWTVPRVSAKIQDLGEKAGVTVNAKGKAASAHDLRRTFAEKWTKLLKPQHLQIVMRHSDIKTTLGYYSGRDADDLLAMMEAAQGDSVGDRSEKAGDENDANQVLSS